MMNIVTHNLLAMNANRQFGIVNKKKAKSTEKLSSGYTINRAADDAAGLSISEKMRRQIRGLHKAEENIQDGISLCQVADGALNETHDILQRMNELSVKAGNDTNAQEDRAYIQAEIDALTDEIDRIANQTSFNDYIYPLLGNNKIGSIFAGGGIEWPPYAQIREFAIVNTWNKDITWDNVVYHNGDIIKGNYLLYNSELDSRSYDYGLDGICAGAAYYFNAGSLMPQLTDAEDVDKRVMMMFSASHSSGSGHSIVSWDIDSEYNIIFESSDGFRWMWGAGPTKDSGKFANAKYAGTEYVDPKWPYWIKMNVKDPAAVMQNRKNGDVWIHTATEPGIGMYINIVNATAKGLGIERLDMSSMENAGNAIDSIKGAIEKVSEYRTVFGAQQNRLEHAMRINANIAENTTDAESRIRDTDVAKKMVAFSNENIVAQAGQSMLSQANQNQQYILSLLS